MPKEISPGSPGIIQSKINLPEPVLTFFQQRGLFVRGLASYEQIVGRSPILPETVIEEWRTGTYEQDSYVIKNSSPEGQQRAEEHASEILARFMKNSASQIKRVNRAYMISGMTLPIRITGQVDRDTITTVYVKKPSVERIFGVLIYNLLSGHVQQEFLFNNYSFVERAITGEHLSQRNFRKMTQRPNFRESLIRLAELDDFVSINDLERKGGVGNIFPNFLVASNGEISAFDFNTILQPEIQERSPLVEVMRAEGVDIPSRYEKQIRADEARCLNARVYTNRHIFDGIVKLIDAIPYMSERIKEKGYRSAKDFFRKRTELLKRDIALA